MLTSKLKFLYLYLLIALLELIVDARILDWQALRYVTKPMLMISLIGYVANLLTKKESKSLFFILIFAWLGDVFLMFSAPIYFPLGLGSFLVMQLLYIRKFAKDLLLKQINWKLQSFVAILFLAYVYLFLNHLWGGVSTELKIPVVVYGVSLGSMAFFAYLRKMYDTEKTFWFVFLGAVFFVISDSLLAYNKFVHSFFGNSFAVMGTYILAQLLLTVGLVNFVIRKRIDNP